MLTAQQLINSTKIRHSDLARSMGVSPAALSKVVNGEREPSVEFADRLARCTKHRAVVRNSKIVFEPIETEEGNSHETGEGRPGA